MEFASKAVSDRDKKLLHSNMLECMAVHWAIAERFRIYLYGLSHFDIYYTDNFAVSHLIKSGATNRRFARWIVDLAEFNFKVHHISGKKNVPADLLSRTTIDSSLLQIKEIICCMIKVIAYHPLLKSLQKEDKFCKEAIINNSSLYQLDQNGILLRKKEKFNKSTIVLPQTLIPETIMKLMGILM